MAEPDANSSDLPPSTARQQALDHLQSVCAQHGIEALVSWPTILQSEEFFPHPIDPNNDRSVLRLVRRLLWYAGIEHLTVELDSVDAIGPPTRGSDIATPIDQCIALVRSDERRCVFRYDRRLSSSNDELTATAAREVARVLHREGREGAADDEALIDATAVYLGFGVLVARTAARDSARPVPADSAIRSKKSLGVLIAARWLLRDGADQAFERAAPSLDPDMQQIIRASLAWLDAEPESLVARLKLPARATWPAQESTDELVAMQSHHPQDVELNAALAFERISSNRGATESTEWIDAHERERERDGFSISWPGDRVLHGLGIGFIVGLISAAAASVRAGIIGFTLFGGVLGAAILRDRCGTRGCYARVTLNKPCPKCSKVAVREGHPWL